MKIEGSHLKKINIFDYSKGILTIPKDIIKIDCEIPKKVKEIRFENGIVFIYTNFFRNMHNIKKVVCPKSLKQIEPYAFYNTDIEEIELNEGLEVINYKSFGQCSELKSINLPITTKKIINRAFEGSGIEEIVFNSNIEELGLSLFENCENLKKVKFYKNLNTDKIKFESSVGYKFVKSKKYINYFMNHILSDYQKNNLSKKSINDLYITFFDNSYISLNKKDYSFKYFDDVQKNDGSLFIPWYLMENDIVITSKDEIKQNTIHRSFFSNYDESIKYEKDKECNYWYNGDLVPPARKEEIEKTRQYIKK